MTNQKNILPNSILEKCLAEKIDKFLKILKEMLKKKKMVN